MNVVQEKILDYKGLNKKPNYSETTLNKILQELYPGVFTYVGDFSIWVGRKNPDFICESRKTIIELFGEYRHKREEEKERTEYFNKYGYQTLIIWAKELDFKNRQSLKERIQAFIEKENLVEKENVLFAN